MGIRTLLYLFRLGLKNLWHHRVYTAASVITMSACIFLFGLFYLAAANVDSIMRDEIGRASCRERVCQYV